MNDFCWSCKFCREDSLSWEEDRYCSCQNEDSDNYLVRIDLITECKDYSHDQRRIRAIFRIK